VWLVCETGVGPSIWSQIWFGGLGYAAALMFVPELVWLTVLVVPLSVCVDMGLFDSQILVVLRDGRCWELPDLTGIRFFRTRTT
jgi:hypothetical protein